MSDQQKKREQRMKDEIIFHLRKNKTTLKEEVELINNKKSQLSASLREYAKVMHENEITKGPVVKDAD
jgi:predicted transcriptional regulator